jgi:hypothetical protein
MKVKKYLGDLIGGSLLKTESRLIAELLLKNLSESEWDSVILEQNILQKKSPKTAIRYARMIRMRLENLGNDFLRLLLDSNETTYSQMLMAALIIHSPIVGDFMRLTLGEAKRIYKPNLTPDAWLEFYHLKVKAYPELGLFSESSIKKMGNNTIKALVDAGYLSDSRKKILQPVFLAPEVKQWLTTYGRIDVIDIMECTI